MKRDTIRQILWTQDWGTYEDHTVVCVGFQNHAEIVEIMRRDNCIEWADAVHAREEDLDELGTCNYFSKWTHKGKEYSILWLRGWRNNRKHYSILGHEIVHAISFVMRDRMDILKENEAFAYQFTYLFKNISEKLDDWYARRKKK